jgi:hypothetical protein
MLSYILHPLWQLFSAIAFSIFPLWWLVDRLKTDALTKLLLTVLANFSFIYLLEFGAYLVHIPQWIPLSLVLLTLSYSIVHIYKGNFSFPFRVVLAWVVVAMWILGLQGLIVCYGGSSWYGDWYEHYERALWFLKQQSPYQRFLFEIWSVPARAPLFNAVCSMFMNSGDDFASFQVYATVLNTFPILPFSLLIRDLANIQQRSALIWAIIFCALAPFAVQQETYTWTKFFTSGILLSGIYFYWLGYSKNNPAWAGLSISIFAMAIIAHYLSIPFAGFFLVHFVSTSLVRKWKPRVLIYTAIACFLIVLPWFGYVFGKFGFWETYRANSTFSAYGTRQGKSPSEAPPWWLVFVGNSVTSTIPYDWRLNWVDTWKGIGLARRLEQRDYRASGEMYVHDSELDSRLEWMAELVTYPNSLLGGIGFSGMIGLMIAIVQVLLRRLEGKMPVGRQNSTVALWVLFFTCVIPLNIAAERGYSAIGIAHLNMQPFFVLTIVFLLRKFRFSRIIGVVLFTIFLFEASLISGSWISLQQRRLPISLNSDNRPYFTGKIYAEPKYTNNYIYKLQTKAVYLSDQLGGLKIPFLLLNSTFAISCAFLIRRNRVKFPVGY